MRADTPMGRRKPASVLSPFVVTQSDLVRREDRHARRLYRRRSFRTRDVHSASASCHACHDGPVAQSRSRSRRNRSNARRHRITRRDVRTETESSGGGCARISDPVAGTTDGCRKWTPPPGNASMGCQFSVFPVHGPVPSIYLG